MNALVSIGNLANDNIVTCPFHEASECYNILFESFFNSEIEVVISIL
jgi:hypothetical protein